LIHLLRRFI